MRLNVPATLHAAVPVPQRISDAAPHAPLTVHDGEQLLWSAAARDVAAADLPEGVQAAFVTEAEVTLYLQSGHYNLRVAYAEQQKNPSPTRHRRTRHIHKLQE